LPCTADPNIGGGAIQTLNPGTYCAITIKGGANVTFVSGTYVIWGGAFSVNSSTVQDDGGAGVTFYMSSTNGAACNACKFTFGGGSSVHFSAPTSGALAGIIFYQDPNVGPNADVTFSSGAGVYYLKGVLYFPANDVTFSGGGTNTSPCTEIVAGSVSFTGSSSLNNNCNDFPDGALISSIALAD